MITVRKINNTIRMIREIMRLLLVLIDTYIDLVNSINQVSCWRDLLRGEK